MAQVAKPVGCRGGSVYFRGTRSGDRSMLKLDRREGTSSTNLGSSNIQTDSLWRRGGHLWAAEKLDPKSSWTFPGVRFQEERR